MKNKFSGLDSLIQSNRQAKQYFESLPDYVREQIKTRSGNVNSYEYLCDYAENLLRGDD